MSDYDTNPDALPMEEIAKQLRHGDEGRRNIVSDADEMIGMSNNCVEVHHHACDGEIIVQLKPHAGWRMGDGDTGWVMSDKEVQKYSVYTIWGDQE